MKFKLLYRFFSLALSFLVLISTSSITVEKHFCGGNLVDSSIFSEVKKCWKTETVLNKNKLSKKPCCKDVIDVLKGQDELNTCEFDNFVTQTKYYFCKLNNYSYDNLFKKGYKVLVLDTYYIPPELTSNKYIIQETFLI